MNISGIVKGAALVCSKHKSAILSGVAIVSGVATAVLCVRQTIKAKEVVDALEEDRRAIAAESTHELVDITKDDVRLKKSEVVKKCWKLYILPTATMAMSVACVVFAHKVDAKRIAAATAALALSEKAYKELEDKTLSEIGKEKVDEIKKKLSQDTIDKTPPRVHAEAVPRASTEERILFRENVTNAEFESTWRYVDKAINELNKGALETCSLITVNDMLDKFNCDPIDIGDNLGWRVDDYLLEYTYDACLTRDGRACIVLKFNKPRLI